MEYFYGGLIENYLSLENLQMLIHYWQNVQINGQYRICHSVKAFVDVLLRSKLKYVQTLANALVFLPAFLNCIRMYSSNFKFQSMIIRKSFCLQLFQTSYFCKDYFMLVTIYQKVTFVMIQFHVIALKPFNS